MDRRRKLHRELFFFFFPRGRFCAFGFRDSWRWSHVRRFACGQNGWNVRPAGWMTIWAGEVRGCFIYIPKNTLGHSQGLLHQKPSYIDWCITWFNSFLRHIVIIFYMSSNQQVLRFFFIYFWTKVQINSA